MEQKVLYHVFMYDGVNKFMILFMFLLFMLPSA